MVDAPFTPIGRQDTAAVARTLAKAFTDDPIMMWIFGDPAGLEAALHILLPHLYTPLGASLTDADRTAAALWVPPGAHGDLSLISTLIFVQRFLTKGRPRAVLRGRQTFDKLHALRPKQPHAYLFMVGVDPSLQGKGRGSQIIRTGIDRLCCPGVPAYLETSTPGLLPYYQGLGFQITGDIQIAPTAPKIWTLIKEH